MRRQQQNLEKNRSGEQGYIYPEDIRIGEQGLQQNR
jgi:hypothetical protein